MPHKLRARRSVYHLKDTVLRKSIENFLHTLRKTRNKLSWIQQETSDSMILEVVHGNAIIKFTRFEPEKSALHHVSARVWKQDQPLETSYHLDITDRARTNGRTGIVNEWFSEISPLFKEAERCFTDISKTARHLLPRTSVAQLSQAACLNELRQSNKAI